MEGSNGNAKIVPIPIRDRTIDTIRNWHEFLMLWNQAKTLEQMLGLLHTGYSVPLEPRDCNEPWYSEVDRLEFYFFAAADGWADKRQFRNSIDEGMYRLVDGVQKSQSEIQLILAQKAFDILCQNFFKKGSSALGMYALADLHDYTGRFSSAILKFFRAEKEQGDDNVGIRNLHNRIGGFRSSNEKSAVAFLLNLAECVWTHAESQDKPHYLAWLETMRPWTIELLSFLGKLDVLEKRLLSLDESSLAKLEEIALRSKLLWHYHPVAKDRPVATLDEACLAGSKEARLLKERDLIQAEQKRLEAICCSAG